MKRTAFAKPSLEKLKAKQKRKIAELFEGKQSSLYKVYSMTVKVKKAPKLKAKKKVSISKLKKKADSVFSQFIRIRDKGKCYTCGLQKHWKEMQNMVHLYICNIVPFVRSQKRKLSLEKIKDVCHATEREELNSIKKIKLKKKKSHLQNTI